MRDFFLFFSFHLMIQWRNHLNIVQSALTIQIQKHAYFITENVELFQKHRYLLFLSNYSTCGNWFSLNFSLHLHSKELFFRCKVKVTMKCHYFFNIWLIIVVTPHIIFVQTLEFTHITFIKIAAESHVAKP